MVFKKQKTYCWKVVSNRNKLLVPAIKWTNLGKIVRNQAQKTTDCRIPSEMSRKGQSREKKQTGGGLGAEGVLPKDTGSFCGGGKVLKIYCGNGCTLYIY